MVMESQTLWISVRALLPAPLWTRRDAASIKSRRAVVQLRVERGENHGQYVSAVAHAAVEFLEQRLISLEQAEEIIAHAAQSDCGRRNQNEHDRHDRYDNDNGDH